MATTAPPPPRTDPQGDGSVKGPSWRLSMLFLMVGVAAVVAAAVVAGPRLLDVYNSPRFEVPGAHELELAEGQWLLYERIRSVVSGEVEIGEQGPAIRPHQVEIEGPAASEPRSALADGEKSIRLGSTTYTGAVQFEILDEGRYTIRVGGDTPAGGEVVVARPVSDLSPWIIVGLLGAVSTVAGAVMWMVGAANRRAARRALDRA